MTGKTNAVFSSFKLTVIDYNDYYDGAAHTITAYVNSQYASSTTIQYRTSTTSSWSNTNPQRTAAGTTTVYVRAVNSTLGTLTATATLTVNPAPVTLTADSDTRTYTGSVQRITTYTCSVSGLRFNGVTASGSGTNVGEYTVSMNGVTLNTTKDTTGNYVVTAVVSGILIITKAAANRLGLSVTSYSGVYDGNSHTVSVYVSVSSGTTFQYSTNNSTWGPMLPNRTAKGTTTVYVRAYNDNYEMASASGTITITDPPRSKITLNWTPNATRAMIMVTPSTSYTYTYSNTPSGYVVYEVTEIGTYYFQGINMTPSKSSITVNSLYNESHYIEGVL